MYSMNKGPSLLNTGWDGVNEAHLHLFDYEPGHSIAYMITYAPDKV